MSEALEILKSCDAFLEGHFLLSSGRHSSAYCQMAYLQQYPDRCAEVMKAVAEKVKELDVDVIVGPAMGGIVYAYELARQTGKRAIFTERVDNVMTLKRFAIHPGEKCLIAEDVVTTGISSLETKRVIEENGGICVGITCVVDRTKPEAPSPIPIVASALKLDLPNYAPEECPICKEGKLPLVHLGSRKMKQEAGARRCIPLKVSGPFHTKLMAPAGDALAQRFAGETFGTMETPVLFNCLGHEKAETDSIPQLLVKQVQSSVYMEDTLRRLGELGVDHILEVGPGNALSGFVKKTLPGVVCTAVETPEQLDAVLTAWKEAE